jgi:GTP cyclohydrolase IA
VSVDLPRAARAVRELLDALGTPVESDPELASTPERVARAWAEELLAGYRMDPSAILADSTASTSSGLVIVRSIQITTMCPHHLLPSAGVAHIGYLPGSRVVGLGAIAKLAECFARRFMLQEDLGARIADALIEHLGARGAGVVLDLAPSCVTARGENQHAARAITTSTAGTFASDSSARFEFFQALALSMR